MKKFGKIEKVVLVSQNHWATGDFGELYELDGVSGTLQLLVKVSSNSGEVDWVPVDLLYATSEEVAQILKGPARGALEEEITRALKGLVVDYHDRVVVTRSEKQKQRVYTYRRLSAEDQNRVLTLILGLTEVPLSHEYIWRLIKNEAKKLEKFRDRFLIKSPQKFIGRIFYYLRHHKKRRGESRRW